MATTPQLLTRISSAFNRQELALNALGFDVDLQGTQPSVELEWIAVRAERVADTLESRANATSAPADSSLDTGAAPDDELLVKSLSGTPTAPNGSESGVNESTESDAETSTGVDAESTVSQPTTTAKTTTDKPARNR